MFKISSRACSFFGLTKQYIVLGALCSLLASPLDVLAAQSPYSGTPSAIPGLIEAENYDLGGPSVAYADATTGNEGNLYRTDNVDIWNASDVSGTYMVGSTKVGEWLEYTVNVATAGVYTLNLRVATAASGKQARVLMDGTDISGPIAIPNTGGWTTWQTINKTVTLTAGQKVMRLQIDAGSFNINWLSFTSANEAPTLSPISNQTVTEGQPLSLPISATDATGPAPLVLSQTNTLPGNPNILTDNGNGTGTLNWTPSLSAATGSPYSISVTATDGLGAFSSMTFSVMVLPNTPPAKPNIVVILTDDQGFGDVSYAGFASDVHTPNIDDLAAHGMRFNNFYANSSVCSPTRAALMTGRFPGLVGVQGTIARDPGTNMGYFSPTGPTLPEMLKSAGYATGMIGKWHLGDYLGGDLHNLPTRRGFDHFHGFIGAAGDYYTHDGSNYGWPGTNLMMLNESVINPATLQGIHTTDLLTQWAKDYIQDKSGSAQPFMMYLAYSAPHDPVQPPQAYLNQVLAREPGIDPERAKLVALIEHMDNSIGQVIQKLKDAGVYNNTLIVFSSDNGGYLLHDANNGPYRGGKLDFYEGGIRVPMAAVWPGVIEPGTQSADVALTMDLYPTLAQAAGATIAHTIDGRSILPTLLSQNPQYAERDLFFGNRSTFSDTLWKTAYAVRRQNWKLVQGTPGGAFELYDLASDPYETQNLAGANPSKVTELMTALTNYQTQQNQVPWQPPLDLERGTLSNVDGTWRTVNLSHTYRAPVVIASVQYPATAMPPVVTRIRNADDLTVDHASFDIKLDRANNQGGTITPATVHYVVVEAGIYNQAHHGAKLEALPFRSTRTDNTSSWVGTQRPYANAYTQPVVLGQVMTYNDIDFSSFWSRGSSAQNAPSASTLYIGKHVGEDPDQTRSTETLGYVVLESGINSLDGLTALAGLSPAQAQGIEDNPPFNIGIAGLSQTESAIVSQEGMKGTNGGWAVLYGPNAISPTQVSVAVDEDQKLDTERSHLTAEQVGYLVFGTQSVMPTVADPTFNPDSGTYQNSTSVQITSTTPGTTIYYTTDGSTPNANSTPYSGPIILTATTTIKAFAKRTGYNDSAVITKIYTIQTSGGGQPPLGGTPWAIPGLIEAENYDLGGSGVAYLDSTVANEGNLYRVNDGVDIWNASDTSGAYMVGTTKVGEWLEYTVNVTTAGTYTLYLRVAAAANSKKLRILMNGVDVTGSITVPNTGGWTTWQTINKTVNLSAGQKVMRLQVDAGSFNINWLSFTATGASSNTPPTLNAIGNQTVNEGQLLSVPISATDPNGPAPLVLSQTNTLPGGNNILTNNGDGNGTLNWTPATGAAANSPYSVTVTATDGAGASSNVTFSVTVLPGNQAPALAPISNQTVIEGQPLTVAVSATDSDGPAPLTLSQTNTLPGSPSILTDNGNGTGTLNWNPAAGAATGSPYSVTVTATDGLGAQSSVTFSVTVLPSNLAPVLTPIGNQTVIEGQSLSIPISATDSGGPIPLTLSQTNTLPGNPGILTDYGSGNGFLDWTPAIGTAAGSPYSVTVTATDGLGAHSSVTFSITVLSNQAPVLSPIGNQTATEGQPLSVAITATDADGPAPLTLSQTNTLPGSPSILTDSGNGTGTLNWTPAAGATTGSPYSITITATDGLGALSSTTLSVTVLPAVSGSLSGTAATAPSSVNLTTEGTTDWIHWGRTSPATPDRKAGVTPQISTYTPIGGANPTVTSQVQSTYSWSDGTPAASISNNKTGLWVFAVGKGFQFSVPADTVLKTVKIYVGATAARGQFTASLSDSSAPAYATTINQTSGRTTRVITLNFRAASPGQSLIISYVADTLYLPNSNSWITLESAALQIQPGGLTLPFSDNFSTGSATNWQTVNDSGMTPNWTTTAGEYRQNNFVGYSDGALQGGYHRGTYSYLIPGTTLDNYQFSVKSVPLADSGQDIGVMVRLNPGSNSYTRLSYSAANGFTRLETRSGGAFHTLAKNARGYLKGTPLNITMKVQGPIVVASVNGEKLFGAYDTSVTSGTVALYCRDQCAFDDVLLQANDTTPTIVLSEPAAYSVAPATTFNAGAVILNKPAGATVELQVGNTLNSCTAASEQGHPGLYTATCTVPSQGVYQITAVLRDSNYVQLDSDTNDSVGVGNNYVALGDSITNGLDDSTSGDGVSQGGWVISSQGYQAILTNLLNNQPYPSIVNNAGVPGDTSANLLNDRIASILEGYPDSNKFITTIGVNDANGTLFTPSGLGCSGSACSGTFKGNLQATIDQMVTAGKTVVVNLAPPRFGDPFQTPYTDPANHSRNLLIRDGYNAVIANELTNRQVGANLYDYFLGSKNRFYLYATNLHPNALGYTVMAQLIHNSLTGNTAPPFVVDDICVKLSAGGACVTPLPYKENLLEAGNKYYVDESYTLTNSIPQILANGRWILTRNQDRNASNNDYLTFNIPEASTLYIAFDTNAAPLPSWLTANFIDTGLLLETSNPAAPQMRLYRQNNVYGGITLGGAGASVNGASANYVAIIVKN